MNNLLDYLLTFNVASLIIGVIVLGIGLAIITWVFNRLVILPMYLKEFNDDSPLDSEDLMALMRKRK